MTIRRTYRLTPIIDRYINDHADMQGVSASYVVREALTVYFAINGSGHPLLESITKLIHHLQPATAIAAPPSSEDRIRQQLQDMGFHLQRKSP
jgi:hypothetical protein